MAEIKELSDDELASVVGGVGDGVDCKYPVGTKFIQNDDQSGPIHTFYEITDVLGEKNGMTYYNFIVYVAGDTPLGPYSSEPQLIENVPDSYFDILLMDGSHSIYHG